MQLVERHVIKQNHSCYSEIDKLAFLSKNLYNVANYLVRQEFILNQKYLNYYMVNNVLKGQIDYKALPAKVSQQVLKLLDKNWVSFFEAIRAYQKNPNQFLGRPKLPKYKDKIKGRNLVVYTKQAISKRELEKKGRVNPSQTKISLPTKVAYDFINEVRLLPKLNHYVVEVVYTTCESSNVLDLRNIASIDLGINNLATVTSNVKGFKPLIINGKPIKSVNHYYNKTKAKLQSLLEEKRQTSKRIQKLSTKRGARIDDYMHKASRYLINHLLSNQIGVLVIGKNDGWKQKSNMGKANNQKFTSLPHNKFIHQLKYKAELVGIQVIIAEESYTSKASFLDLDSIPTYKKDIKHSFSGRRLKRGMYKAKLGNLINADVNGSYNIMRKVVPNAFSNGIKGVVVHPVKVTL
jgi:putative transposase